MYPSWGNYPTLKNKHNIFLQWRDAPVNFQSHPFLAYGNGRSYGDSCLNHDGTLIHTRHLNHFIAFDKTQRTLHCEAGVNLKEILTLITSENLMLPAVPGTQFVTVGGAIANDIHGKNHRHQGTFGAHVTKLELHRSDQSRIWCSPTQNRELFNATIGGLGLTGLITQAEIKLNAIPGPFLTVEKIPFNHLEEFFDIDAQSHHHEYTVAWLDCLGTKRAFGRGIYMRANFTDQQIPFREKSIKTIPLFFPNFVLNRFFIQLFNQCYFHKEKSCITKLMHYSDYFFPLDSLYHWNKIYGKRGFLQYQCLIPSETAQKGLTELLKVIVESRLGSFLSVLKTFGEIKSPGLLSFPKPGVTLALDFPNKPDTHRLFERLDAIVCAHQGRIYPAKDAHMNAQAFEAFYPTLSVFKKYIDPYFSSSFWRRVTS